MSYLTQKLWKNDRNMPPAGLPGMTPHIETRHTRIGAPTLGKCVDESRLQGRWSYATSLWNDDPFWEPEREIDTDPGYKENATKFSTDWSTESSRYDILP